MSGEPQQTEKSPALIAPTVRWHGLAIAAAAFVLLINCWGVSFLPYDDSKHVFENKYVIDEHSWSEFFGTPTHSTYFPLTLLSYRLDKKLFNGGRSEPTVEWATGIRAMTCLYHAAAGVLLWRIFLTLGLSSLQSLCLALIFTLHPMACETVCWVSERKTALAGLFGFAAILAWLSPARFTWRLPLTFILYSAALLSKPSALGLLPVFALIEVLKTRKCGFLPIHVTDADPGKARTNRIFQAAALLLPVALISFADITMNMAGHKKTIVPPPGGNMITALFTDTEIICRYLFNFILPIRLSVSYYVEPIVSPGDTRLLIFVVLIGMTVAFSLKLALKRSRALFGWLWFFLALGPHLNLIALSQLMQDRYLYFALPGLLLVLNEVALGIQASVRQINVRLFRLAACAYVVLLGALSLQRSEMFRDTMHLFSDAASKQPLSSHAQYGLALAYERESITARLSGDTKKAEELHQMKGELCLKAMACPDVKRQVHFSQMALDAGEYMMEKNDLRQAQLFLKDSIDGLPGIPPADAIQSQALKAITKLMARVRNEQTNKPGS